MIDKNSWDDENKWESSWWGDCLNTYNEEVKQVLYAQKMGLKWVSHQLKSPYFIDLKGASVLDIGGGPVSMLLKTFNGGEKAVVDPLAVPEWVKKRYELAGIFHKQMPAENINTKKDKPDNSGFVYDEIWIYNCLQHTIDPQKIIENARQVGKLIRIFEWIDQPQHVGHPHTLTEKNLNEWLHGWGRVERLTGQNSCAGKAYYGVFPTGQT